MDAGSDTYREQPMLLRAEDQAQFRAQIVEDGGRIGASYWIEGLVKNEPMAQSDKRLFASEQEARTWLVGEAEHRGFRISSPRSAPHPRLACFRKDIGQLSAEARLQQGRANLLQGS
jgi:hypothetical protein